MSNLFQGSLWPGFFFQFSIRMISVFLRRFEEPKRSLKIVQRFLKISKFLWKQLLIAVLFTNLKIGGLLTLLNGSSSQTLKKNTAHD